MFVLLYFSYILGGFIALLRVRVISSSTVLLSGGLFYVFIYCLVVSGRSVFELLPTSFIYLHIIVYCIYSYCFPRSTGSSVG